MKKALADAQAWASKTMRDVVSRINLLEFVDLTGMQEAAVKPTLMNDIPYSPLNTCASSYYYCSKLLHGMPS